MGLDVVAAWAETLRKAGRTEIETVLDYWSLKCQANGMTALGPVPSPGLCGDKCRPVAPEAGPLCSEMELSHTVTDEQCSSIFRGIYAPHAPPVHLATAPQIFLCTSPRNVFLMTSQGPDSRPIWQTCLGPGPCLTTKLLVLFYFYRKN